MELNYIVCCTEPAQFLIFYCFPVHLLAGFSSCRNILDVYVIPFISSCKMSPGVCLKRSIGVWQNKGQSCLFFLLSHNYKSGRTTHFGKNNYVHVISILFNIFYFKNRLHLHASRCYAFILSILIGYCKADADNGSSFQLFESFIIYCACFFK